MIYWKGLIILLILLIILCIYNIVELFNLLNAKQYIEEDINNLRNEIEELQD